MGPRSFISRHFQDNGEATQSVTAKLLNRLARLAAFSSEEEEVIKNVCAVAFEGTVRTTLHRKRCLSHFHAPSWY